MKTVDTRGLKAKHHLEKVMQELGEKFQANGEYWDSQTTPGLRVYLNQQAYEYQRPGMDKESGDVISWLRHRFNWSFKQTITYLKKRKPDPASDEFRRAPNREVRSLVETFQATTLLSEFSDPEKEASGLYEECVACLDGKTHHYYLLKPVDALQERALEIGGEKIRDLFTWTSKEILLEKELQPSRFIPVQDMDISTCDECGNPLEWWWKQKPHYVHQEKASPGMTGIAWEKVRVIEEPQVYAFEYELFEETFSICENCKRKMINYREAMDLLYRSARKREREALSKEEHREIALQV